MRVLRRFILTAAVLMAAPQAYAQERPLRIGVLEDMSGSYADTTGIGSLTGAQMAAADVGSVLGRKVEIVFIDTVSKPDVALGAVRRWLDQEGVEMVVGHGSSAVALAVRSLMSERGKIDIAVSSLTSDLSGKACSPTSFQWISDTYVLAKTIGAATVRSGADTYFSVSTDYAFGAAMIRDGSRFANEAGGRSVGEVRVPVGTPDYGSFILQAQASRAKAIMVGLAGQDMVNFVKQANEFGVTRSGQKLASFVTYVGEIKALGLAATQGLLLAEAFYWDQSDEARAFSQRFFQLQKRMPNSLHAGMYSAVAHYLAAVKAAGTIDGKAVAAKMRETPVNDFMTANAAIREDGRVLRDFYLFQVKTPEESKGEWDLMKPIQKLSGTEAFRPLAESECPLVKKN